MLLFKTNNCKQLIFSPNVRIRIFHTIDNTINDVFVFGFWFYFSLDGQFFTWLKKLKAEHLIPHNIMLLKIKI